MWTNELTGLLIFIKLTHQGTKFKTRNRTLPIFQKFPSTPLPVATLLLYRDNHFPEDYIFSEHYSNGSILYAWLQNHEYDIKLCCCRQLSFIPFHFYIYCLNATQFIYTIYFCEPIWGHFKFNWYEHFWTCLLVHKYGHFFFVLRNK